MRVTCEETVVAGGTRTTQWQVRDGAMWLAAHRHPTCISERSKSPPGTVWQEVLTLQLSVGAELKQVISEPLPAKPHSVFEYLRREVRNTRRATREIRYAVDSTGKLTRLLR
ncbi:MAG TPA: hypothetical protein VHO25_25055 [Polyangiaceae bacterium]|nr:hypothetical protein [Polyangiaceae bacterium]